MEGFLPDWLQLTLLIGTCVIEIGYTDLLDIIKLKMYAISVSFNRDDEVTQQTSNFLAFS